MDQLRAGGIAVDRLKKGKLSFKRFKHVLIWSLISAAHKDLICVRARCRRDQSGRRVY